MKRYILVLSLLIFFLFVSSVSVCAQDSTTEINIELSEEMESSLGLDSMFSELPENARESLRRMGISEVSVMSLSDLTFSRFLFEIASVAGEQTTETLGSFAAVLSMLIIYSIVDGFSQSLTSDAVKEVLSVVCGLCIACAVVIPITDLIDTAATTINAACNLMLAYIPIMVAVLITCGKALSGSGYYSLMIGAAEVISQLSAKFITPMMNVFLGVSLCSTVVPTLRLTGLTSMFSKVIKWLLSFSFTIFSAFLTFKTLISTSIDSVSTRAVRFTMSSFIPVVGAALSEAYKTVQGSVNILKSGVGVFVILAVIVVFLPLLIRLLMWIISVNICKSFSEIINLKVPHSMLSSITTVLSVILAVILCIMALFIISTALIITAGGGAS